MRYQTLRNKRDAALNELESLFHMAEVCGMSASDLIQSYGKIREKYFNIPRWAKEYLQGVFDTRWKDLYRHKLAFGGYYDGVFYTTHSNRDDYYAKHGIEPIQWAEKTDNGLIKVTHYWITTKEPKPFGKLESE